MKFFIPLVMAGLLCGLILYLYRQACDGKIAIFNEGAGSSFIDSHADS